MITLITPTQGNPVALSRTIDSVKEKFGDLLTQVMVGDVCPFKEDSDKIATMRGKIPVDIHLVKFDMAYIFNFGFSAILNELARFASNNLILYMNVSEVIEGPAAVNLIHPQYNCFKFDHATETHKWFRLYDKRECRWAGRIHEEVVGGRKDCPEILFRMADTPKDNGNPFKAWVYNWIKEVTYFQQYRTIATNEREIGPTNQGWVNWSKEQESHPTLSFTARINKHSQLLMHFITNDYKEFLKEARKCYEASEEFVNTDMIHYQ